jgi:hypothetical protein
LSVDGQQGIVEMKINDLPSEFLLTELQKERLTVLPQYIVQNHIQVVNHNGTFYHLSPDLVFNVNQIVLCCVCVRPRIRKGPFLELALPVLVRVPVLEQAGPRSRTGIAF